MSHPNHQRRRKRAFRVEALESRALLSTAGVVFSRPAAAVAPLARSAQFSNIAADPEFRSEMKGTFRIVHDQFQFLSSGFVSGHVAGVLAFGNQSTFNGSVGVGEMLRVGTTKYTSGYATLTSNLGTNWLMFHVAAAVEGSNFRLDGRTVNGGGVFAGLHGGNIDGHGHINRNTGIIHFQLTAHVP
jgi:hypothetical protein